MTRSEVDPLHLTIEAVETPIGGLFLVSNPIGVLRAVEFADREDRLHRLLDRRLGVSTYALRAGQVSDGIKLAFVSYFAGDITAIESLSILGGGTSFQEAVWCALRSIHAGFPTTYAALASRLGSHGSARAVGQANAANPFEIVVPCHRLVGSSGALRGYAGGLERKRWLLEHEALHCSRIETTLRGMSCGSDLLKLLHERRNDAAHDLRSLA